MIRKWMIAGLMGATVLSGTLPTIATAQDQQHRNPRWSEGRGNDNRSGANRRPADVSNRAVAPRVRSDDRPQRAERRGDVRTVRQERAPDVRQRRPDRQVQRDDRRDDRREWRQVQRDDRRDWRQDRRDDRRDRNNDRRDDRRDWRQDRNHNWRDNDRRSYRNADRRHNWNREWRNDRRYDWRDYRSRYRDRYRYTYYAPRGWDYGYRRFSIGISLWSGLYSDRYWISDPYYYRLPPAYGTLRWIRYYEDALLVDIRTGYVVDVIHDFFW